MIFSSHIDMIYRNSALQDIFDNTWNKRFSVQRRENDAIKKLLNRLSFISGKAFNSICAGHLRTWLSRSWGRKQTNYVRDMKATLKSNARKKPLLTGYLFRGWEIKKNIPSHFEIGRR